MEETSGARSGPFLVLRLPVELRLKIWKYALDIGEHVYIRWEYAPCKESRIALSSSPNTDADDADEPKVRYEHMRKLWRHDRAVKDNIGDDQYLSLFLVNRQVYQEAMPIYYSQSYFIFKRPWVGTASMSVYAALAFLKYRPPAALLNIRRICLQVGLPVSQSTQGLLMSRRWPELVAFVKLSLPNLNHLKLDFDLELNVTSRGAQQQQLERDLVEDAGWIGQLGPISVLNRLTMSVHAADPGGMTPRLCCFIKELRDSILENGARLGYDNIRVRSIAPNLTALFLFHPSYVDIQCDDDYRGNSYLQHEPRPTKATQNGGDTEPSTSAEEDDNAESQEEDDGCWIILEDWKKEVA